MKRRETPIIPLAGILLVGALSTCAVHDVDAREPQQVYPAASAAARDVVDKLVATYRYAGGEKEQKARDAAIDAVVADMNVLIRGIARDRLKESNKIAQSLVVSRSGDKVTFSHDGRIYTAAIDGPPVTVESVTGDEVSLRYLVRGEQLVQVFQGEDGGRENTYRLDGKKTVMHVRVHSDKLSKDVVYQLTYAR